MTETKEQQSGYLAKIMIEIKSKKRDSVSKVPLNSKLAIFKSYFDISLSECVNSSYPQNHGNKCPHVEACFCEHIQNIE